MLLVGALVTLVSVVPSLAAPAQAVSNTSAGHHRARETTLSTGSLTSDADTYVTPETPDTNYGQARSMIADGAPVADAYLSFDTAAYQGKTLDHALLWVTSKDATGG